MDQILQAINKLQVSIDAKFDETNKKLDATNKKLDETIIKVDENTQILRALEHSAQVNKAEHDQFTHTLATMQGDIVNIKKDLLGVEAITAKNWNDIIELKVIK